MWLTIPRAPYPSSSRAIRLTRSSTGPCKLAVIPPLLRSRIGAPATSPTTRSSSPQIFAELNPDFKDPKFDGNGEARDLGKRGVVHAFPAGNANPPITKITLAPLTDSGFTANRVAPNNFCNTVPPAQSNIFCPNPDDPTDPVNTNNPQGVFPNQLLSAVIRGNRLYLPNIGAQPEPPEIFNANVQALVYAVDTEALAEVAAGLRTGT